MLAGAVRACDTNTAPRTQGRGSQTDCEGLHFSVMSWRTHPHLAEINALPEFNARDFFPEANARDFFPEAPWLPD